MSAPKAIWISIETSGLMKWDEPSKCERKATPSSEIFRRSAKLKTWKPPLFCQDRPVPAHKVMEAAGSINKFVPWSQMKMIGIR